MDKPSRWHDAKLWSFLSLVAVWIILIYAVATRLLLLNIDVGGESLHHWFTWAGTLYIAVAIPIIHILKLRHANWRTKLTIVHVFGNIIAVIFISLHLTHQLARAPPFTPELGTGIVLVTILLLEVTTGFILQFIKPLSMYKSLKFVHVGIILAFYMVIVVHILHGEGLI